MYLSLLNQKINVLEFENVKYKYIKVLKGGDKNIKVYKSERYLSYFRFVLICVR